MFVRSLKFFNYYPKTNFHSNLSIRRSYYYNNFTSNQLNCKLNFISNQLDNNKFQFIHRKLTTSPSPSPSPSPSSSNSTLYNRLIKNKKLSKYVLQFRSKPTSYIISFLILHEITAIIPIPIFYICLSSTGIKIPFPQKILDEGNKYINRVVVHYGYEPFEDGSRVALNLATSYTIVKFLMPVRIAICIWLTPKMAERIIGPITELFKRITINKIKNS
ncbi:hypothetical protein Glove_431g26 [Diversispora epigaea]|uniref:Uncharacterized protein n=1 Tax=Diversispora epigaea TaxID=1348612 RepID=A0A397GTA9_9GLOM|nr:hypothetical protein Glove_431g26 [Diversispora epigaea]